MLVSLIPVEIFIVQVESHAPEGPRPETHTQQKVGVVEGTQLDSSVFLFFI